MLRSHGLDNESELKKINSKLSIEYTCRRTLCCHSILLKCALGLSERFCHMMVLEVLLQCQFEKLRRGPQALAQICRAATSC